MARRESTFWRVCSDICVTDFGLEICLDFLWIILEILLTA